MGILYNWIEDQRFDDWLRWDKDGDAIEITDAEKFIEEMNKNGVGVKEMKTFMSKFKSGGWLCRCLEKRGG